MSAVQILAPIGGDTVSPDFEVTGTYPINTNIVTVDLQTGGGSNTDTVSSQAWTVSFAGVAPGTYDVQGNVPGGTQGSQNGVIVSASPVLEFDEAPDMGDDPPPPPPPPAAPPAPVTKWIKADGKFNAPAGTAVVAVLIDPNGTEHHPQATMTNNNKWKARWTGLTPAANVVVQVKMTVGTTTTTTTRKVV